MSPELISTAVPLVSGIAGFVFQSIGTARKQRHQEILALAKVGNGNANDADKRGGTWGTVIRFMLVASSIAGVILIPWMAANYQIPIVSEVVTHKTGLFGKSKEVVEYVTLNGFPVFNEVKVLLASAGMFYIGRLPAK